MEFGVSDFVNTPFCLFKNKLEISAFLIIKTLKLVQDMNFILQLLQISILIKEPALDNHSK